MTTQTTDSEQSGPTQTITPASSVAEMPHIICATIKTGNDFADGIIADYADKMNANAYRVMTLADDLTAARQKIAEQAARIARIDDYLERKAWVFIRSCMTQGVSIHEDYLAGNHDGYEAYSARIDAAARERRDALHDALAALQSRKEGE